MYKLTKTKLISAKKEKKTESVANLFLKIIRRQDVFNERDSHFVVLENRSTAVFQISVKDA